jgi:hypothetical protein
MNNFWEIQIEKTYFRCQSLFFMGYYEDWKKVNGTQLINTKDCKLLISSIAPMFQLIWSIVDVFTCVVK